MSRNCQHDSIADGSMTFVGKSQLMRRNRIISLTAVTLAVLATAGCGGSDETKSPQVPTLRSATATAQPPDQAQERPVIRPDATEADIANLERAYMLCLKNAGVDVDVPADGPVGKPKSLDDPRMPAASKICASKEPESWFDRERRDNPEFVDRLREAVKCLKDKGFEARLDGDPVSIRYESTAEFMRAGDAEIQCTNEAFLNRIKEVYGTAPAK
jgi:hypothetical protein